MPSLSFCAYQEVLIAQSVMNSSETEKCLRGVVASAELCNKAALTAWKCKCDNGCLSRLCVSTVSTFLWESENYGRDENDFNWCLPVKHFPWFSAGPRRGGTQAGRDLGQPRKRLASLWESLWQATPLLAFVSIENNCWYHKHDSLNLN